MTTALDAYTDLVAERLAVLGRGVTGHSPHGGHTGKATSVYGR